VKKKKQHYIPVTYQRGFTEGYPGNIGEKAANINLWVYDRNENKYFKKGLNNIFQLPHYYSIFLSGGKYDTQIEDALSGYESDFARISEILFVEHHVRRNSRCRLLENYGARESLAYYMSLQLRRVPKFRKPTEEYWRNEGNLKTEQEVQNWTNWSMVDVGEGNHEGVPSFHEVLLKKNWRIYCILNPKKHFISTDAPFCLFNSDGIGNEETEIWFPVNKKILVVLSKVGKPLEVIGLNNRIEGHDRLIDFVNQSLAQQADRYVYSQSETFLRSIIKRIDPKLRIEYAVGRSPAKTEIDREKRGKQMTYFSGPPYNNRFNPTQRGRHAFCSCWPMKVGLVGKSHAGTPNCLSFPGQAIGGHSFAG
jgi:hypothetical protein